MRDKNPYRNNPALAQAAMTQSDRMRGTTVSVPDRGPRVGELWLVRASRTEQTKPPEDARPRVSRHPHGRAHHARAPRRPRAQATRSSVRSGDSGDDSESSEPPERRLCENARCRADISRRPKLARYCDDACQQEAYRDRRTIEVLEEMSGTIAEGLSCRCAPKGHIVIGGVCFHCGKPRGAVTRGWLDDGVRARPFVSMRSPARKKPRYGDRKPKPVKEFVDESIIGAVAA